MNVLCVIPARSGSQGLKDKNISLFNGEPLLVHAVRQALRIKNITDVVVSTDSLEYSEIARNAGALVPFIRPQELAQNETTMEDTLRHALCETETILAKKYDICVFMTCTDVFRKDEYITNVIQRLHDDERLESAFVANISYKNFWESLPFGQYQRVRTYMQIYGQRQERIKNRRLIYREDTGIASASRSFVWKQGRRIGDCVDIIDIDDSLTSLDIHTEEDLRVAEFAFNLRNRVK